MPDYVVKRKRGRPSEGGGQGVYLKKEVVDALNKRAEKIQKEIGFRPTINQIISNLISRE
jgi:hypothetical protein